MNYIVLGMHKSGTTLVSKTLHQSGIMMGNFNLNRGYDNGNKFESEEFKHLNFQMLNCNSKKSYNVTNTVKVEDLNCKIHKESQDLISYMESEYEAWGFKDPRTCLTIHFWDKELPRSKIIYIYRSPKEVFNHYIRCEQKGDRFLGFVGVLRKITSNPILACKVLHSWYVYNQECLQYLEGLEDKDKYLILSFAEIFNNREELHRLEKFLEKPIVNIVQSTLYRSPNRTRLLFTLSSAVCKLLFGRDVLELYNRIESFRKMQLSAS